MGNDFENSLRKDWINTIAEFEYDLSERGYDAILDGEPGALGALFKELRQRLATLEFIGVALAQITRERHEKEAQNG